MAGTATFFPGEDDYLAALAAHYRSRFRGRRLWRLIALVGLTSAALTAVIALVDGDWVAALAGGIGGIAGGLGVIGIFVLLGRFMLPRWSRRLYRQQRTLHQEHSLAWDDTGIRWQTPTSNARFAWNEFHGWREARATFLIYLNDQLFHFIPRRALDPAAADDLRATLTAHGPAMAR